MHKGFKSGNKSYRSTALITASLVLGGSGIPAIATAQDEVELEVFQVEDVQDDFSILPSEPSEGAFGFNKSLLETPRSVSEVTSDLVLNYGLRSVDDLVRLTPGAFTSSFFGIQGAMDIRGEAADNYFRGFRRVANPGAFKTNIRGADELEIMRGPVSPYYGTGSVGGQLNYTPKSAKSDTSKYISEPTGRVDLTVGTYDQFFISGELGFPITIGDKSGGIYIFGEHEDSKSFFDLYEPNGSMLQVAMDLDLSSSTVFEVGFQYQEGEYIQVPGWNRVTQDLIDSKTYITGAPPAKNSTNPIGADRLLPQESGFVTSAAPFFINSSFSNVGSFCSPSTSADGNYVYNGMDIFCPGVGTVSLDPATVGTTTLDHSTTFIDELDFSDTTAFTAYMDFTTDLENGMTWKNQVFYDYMDHTKYQSWGFTALYPDANLYEFRSSITMDIETEDFFVSQIFGLSYRVEDLDMRGAFYDETFDFRDISVGATPDDRIDWAVEDPYADATITYDAMGNPTGLTGTVRRNFNEFYVSENANTGLFYLADITVDKLSVLLGARYDYYDVEATTEGRGLLGILFVDADSDNLPDVEKGTEEATSYNVSLSYSMDNGLVPYVTYAEANSLSANQLGGIVASTVSSGEFIQGSDLFEAGLKMNLMDGRLYSAISYYDQEKSYRDGQTNALVAVYGDGLEFELRGVLNDNYSITATATKSDTTEVSNGALAVINGADFAAQNGLQPWEVYGGRIAGSRATFVGENVELERGGLPDTIASLYLNYSQPMDEGRLSGSIGMTYASSTYTDVLATVKLPSYTAWTASLGYMMDQFEVLLSINNLFDEEYYTSADLFDSVVVKPSEGRTASLMFTYKY